MHLTTENILFISSILLIISILASNASQKYNVPTLIFFLIIGMLAGSEGIGKINFYEPKIAQFIGIIALNFILFSGGFSNNWKSIKPIVSHGILLSTLAVLITAAAVGVFVWKFAHFTIYEGLLLGAIVSSTDAAAVFSILRSKKLSLKGNLRPLLELESGSNDPMAYFLTIAFTGLVINQDKSFLSIIPLFFKQIIIGTALGFLFGIIAEKIINKIKIEFESLYPILIIALVFLTFSVTDFVGGNGFLAVYLFAVYLGNKELIQKRTIIKAFNSYAWLMEIVLFLTLGLLVVPSQITSVIGIGLLISIFLILIARPLSIFLSLSFSKVNTRNKLFISWFGLRGAIPIVFATYPLIAGVEKANMIFNIVFFISLSSIIIQGTPMPLIAKWLHVSLPLKVKARTPSEIEISDSVKSELVEIPLPHNSPVIGKQIYQINFPKKALIVMIKRDEKYITPNGSTVLEQKDKLLIIAENKENLDKVYDSLKISKENGIV